tara:strand:+ start:116 stop:349 length:234 start_codon:yes stop_codon:yes gene_type:complete
MENIKSIVQDQFTLDQIRVKLLQNGNDCAKALGMLYMEKSQLHPKSEYHQTQAPKRDMGIPVGLKNIGNTCYFNSLI